MLEKIQNLIVDGELSPSEVVVLLILIKRADIVTVRASLKVLSKDCCLSVACTGNALKSLASKKIIKSKANYSEEGGRQSNSYEVLI